MTINVFELRKISWAMSRVYLPKRIRPLRLIIMSGDWVKSCSIVLKVDTGADQEGWTCKKDLHHNIIWKKL